MFQPRICRKCWIYPQGWDSQVLLQLCEENEAGWANRLACLLLYQLPKTQTLFFWHAEDSAWGPVQAYIKGILHISKKSPDVQEKMIWNGRQVKQGKFFLVSVFITSCSLVLKYFNHFHCSFSMFYKLQPPHLKPKNHDNCVTILPVCV